MTHPCDILVLGSGAAGLAAAVASARHGCRTVLLDRQVHPGGTGGWSGLNTLCGLYDDAGNVLNNGLARELAEAISDASPVRMGRAWVLPYRPARFRETARHYLAHTPGLELHSQTPLRTVKVEARRITSVNGIGVRAVIDASGTAEIARALGLACLHTDEATQSPAVLFPLFGVGCPLDTPAACARVMLPLVRAGYPPACFQPGLDPGEVTVKFSGTVEQVPELVAFLLEQVPGFADARTEGGQVVLARRAGRMIPGHHLLTGEDVRSGRRFPDAVAHCAWPIEQWGPDGFPHLEYLPPGTHYDIPARALRARDCDNLFMAGKTISADVDAIASARVMGCCLATGAAAGKLASVHRAANAADENAP